MNPFICGKYVCGTEVRTLYSIIADKEQREGCGRSQYDWAKYFRDAQGAWQVLDFRRSPPRNPVLVTDQELIVRLDQVRLHAKL